MGAIKNVSALELKKLIAEKKVKLVDIRERDEYETGYIKNSINIPSSKFDLDLIESLEEENIVIYCLSGKRCCNNVMKQLENSPNNIFYKLEGGINSWKEYKGEIVGVKVKFRLIQQVFMLVGFMIILSVVLAYFNVNIIYLISVLGIGLIFASVTGFCMMAKIFSFMPWNSGGKSGNSDVGKLLFMERQVMFVAGIIILIGSLLGINKDFNYVYLSAFIGFGLFFAGITGWCGMAKLFAFLPWNK